MYLTYLNSYSVTQRKQSKRKTLFLLMIFMTLNILFPAIEDDYYYSKYYNIIIELNNILVDQYNDYLYLNARLGGIFGRFFIDINGIGFDIMNTIMMFLFVNIIIKYLYIEPKVTVLNLKKINQITVAMISLIFPSIWVDSYFWASGAVNYLWSFSLLLYFFFPFFYVLFKDYESIKIHPFTTLIGGIFIGFTNENSVLALVSISILWIFMFHEYKKIPQWFWIGLLGMTIGNIVLLSAPGYSVRLSKLSELGFDYENEVLWDKLIRTVKNILYLFVYNFIVTLSSIGLLFLFLKKKKFNFYIVNTPILYFLLLSLTATLAFSFSPVSIYRGRTSFIISIFLFLSFYSLWLFVKSHLAYQYVKFFKYFIFHQY